MAVETRGKLKDGSGFCMAVVSLITALAAVPHPAPAQAAQAIAPGAAPQVADSISVIPPQTPPTAEQLGDALMMHQRYQAAVDAYRKIARPSAAEWNKMGIANQMLLNLDQASRCYRAALKLDPRNPRVLNNLGTIYDLTKEPRAAERMYRRAIKLDPNAAITYKNLGTNLFGQEKIEKGWEAYKRALAIDPNVFQNTANPRVQDATSVEERGALNYYMARGCAHTGQVDCAIEHLRMALIEGYTTPKKLMADAEFSSLVRTQAFQQLMADQAAPGKLPRLGDNAPTSTEPAVAGR